MKKTLFVTGTDTGVGKTVVTAAIVRYLRNQGVDAVTMKPVQTGASEVNGRKQAEDLDFHCRAAGLEPDDETRALMAPYLFEPACSPHLAARTAGVTVELPHIVQCLERLTTRHDIVVVEGAGGVMVPLNEKDLMLDLMVQIGAPVVLTAAIGLGTINHCLLSLRVMRDAGLEVLGVVFNEPERIKRDIITEDNPDAVAAFGQVPVLGNLDHRLWLEAADDNAFETILEQMPGLADIAQRLKQ
jgi:dethiobiotin synthetase